MTHKDEVHLRDLARGVLHLLPQTPTLGKGLWNLARLTPDRPASIGLQLERVAERTPAHTALVFDEQRWTYAEFNGWVNRIAAVFRANGVGSGDTVAILMENRPDVLACVAATVKLGAVAAMLNHNQQGEVLAHSIRLTAPKLVVVGGECRETLQSTPYHPDADPDRQYFWTGPGMAPDGYLDLQAAAASQSAANPPETQRVLSRQPCFFIFTSGTTGLPKASVMTHYRWLRGMAGLGQLALRLEPDDAFYCPLPLYHNNALTVSWGAVLGAGCTLVLGRKFSASRFWDEVRRHDVTAFCYIGELLRYLLNRPPSPQDRDHLVRLICGNGLRPEIWEQFQQRFGIERIYEFYGASESNLAFVNAFGLSRTAGFCPMSFAIVEFDAEAEQPRRGSGGFLSKVERGGTGLLITEISEKSPFDGYTDRKASEAKLLRDVFKKGDCWFNTGDLVRDQGWRHIQFVDRLGDTFRWKGENVATTEVEAALNRFPGIEHAVVYGVTVPGADGRAGMAALSYAGEHLDGSALAEHLRRQLPAYAVPLFLRLRPEHETTGTFKYRKVDLKREAFDPSQVADPLYALLDADNGYRPITPEIFQKIQKGEVRL
ncbi:MAG: long-chain-acyl-CoA synthetase [Nevskia sp.]|nr:long-chain-acyl-CoA synthetase [Nevskia sp.]